MEIGAQFYTVRELCKDINGFADTLKRVADIGYKNVQISGTCEFDPEWLKAELAKNGLKCVLTHTPADKLKADPAGVARDHQNHDQEFKKENGKLIIERLAEITAPDEMGFTLDTFWVQAGGGDPAQWLEKLSGRVPCIHLKDYAYGRKMAVIGEGNINFDRVFEKAESAGTEYMLVEQDDCNGENPLDCLKRSFEYLKSRGF